MFLNENLSYGIHAKDVKYKKEKKAILCNPKNGDHMVKIAYRLLCVNGMYVFM